VGQVELGILVGELDRGDEQVVLLVTHVGAQDQPEEGRGPGLKLVILVMVHGC
jgi:hypothetical protein